MTSPSRLPSWLGLVASCISLFVFFTGVPSLPHLLARKPNVRQLAPQFNFQAALGPGLTVLVFFLGALILLGVAFLLSRSLSRLLGPGSVLTVPRGFFALAVFACFAYAHYVLYRVVWAPEPLRLGPGIDDDKNLFAFLAGYVFLFSVAGAGMIQAAGLFPLFSLFTPDDTAENK